MIAINFQEHILIIDKNTPILYIATRARLGTTKHSARPKCHVALGLLPTFVQHSHHTLS